MAVIMRIGSMFIACLNLHLPHAGHTSVSIDQSCAMIEALSEGVANRLSLLKSKLKQQGIFVNEEPIWICGGI